MKIQSFYLKTCLWRHWTLCAPQESIYLFLASLLFLKFSIASNHQYPQATYISTFLPWYHFLSPFLHLTAHFLSFQWFKNTLFQLSIPNIPALSKIQLDVPQDLPPQVFITEHITFPLTLLLFITKHFLTWCHHYLFSHLNQETLFLPSSLCKITPSIHFTLSPGHCLFSFSNGMSIIQALMVPPSTTGVSYLTFPYCSTPHLPGT